MKNGLKEFIYWADDNYGKSFLFFGITATLIFLISYFAGAETDISFLGGIFSSFIGGGILGNIAFGVFFVFPLKTLFEDGLGEGFKTFLFVMILFFWPLLFIGLVNYLGFDALGAIFTVLAALSGIAIINLIYMSVNGGDLESSKTVQYAYFASMFFAFFAIAFFVMEPLEGLLQWLPESWGGYDEYGDYTSAAEEASKVVGMAISGFVLYLLDSHRKNKLERKGD